VPASCRLTPDWEISRKKLTGSRGLGGRRHLVAIDTGHTDRPSDAANARTEDVRSGAAAVSAGERPTDAEHHPPRVGHDYTRRTEMATTPECLRASCGPTVDHCALAGGRRRRHRWRARAGTGAAQLLSRGWQRRRGRRWRTGPRGRPGWRPAEPPGTRRRWCPAGPGSPWHWRRRWARSRG
jgi:hypothetical protein